MEDKFIHKKVNEVMQSFEGIQKAAAPSFLFTRLEARMLNEKNIWVRVSLFVARPVVAFASICFILIVNAMVIFLVNTSGTSLSQGNELATADEYSQVSSTLYEFEK